MNHVRGGVPGADWDPVIVICNMISHSRVLADVVFLRFSLSLSFSHIYIIII